MPYSQKYTLVQFFQQVDENETFAMDEWPLHMTLADVFAVNVNTELFNDLQEYINTEPLAQTKIINDATLGTTSVWLLDKTPELLAIHTRIVDILEDHGAVFNTPEFTRDGFVPHITKQQGTEMSIGDNVIVNVFSLVDMFPGGDWQQRKVIATFLPKSPE